MSSALTHRIAPQCRHGRARDERLFDFGLYEPAVAVDFTFR
jgi:hypothetical protein